MAEETDVLQKLIVIAADPQISRDLRVRAIAQLGRIGTHAALAALLDLVGNEAFPWEERMLSLKQAEKILRPPRSWWHALKPRGQT